MTPDHVELLRMLWDDYDLMKLRKHSKRMAARQRAMIRLAICLVRTLEEQ